MGIQKDAGEILAKIYHIYVHSTKNFVMNQDYITHITGWDSDRIFMALKYLNEKNIIECLRMGDGDFKITNITPKGIDIIEDKKKFKIEFGINLGVINLNVK